MAYYPFRTEHAVGEAVDPDDLQVFEPTFTSYTLKCSVEDTISKGNGAFAIATAVRKVIVTGWPSPAYHIYSLDIDTGTLTDTGVIPSWTPTWPYQSANGRYFVIVARSPQDLLIFKDGELLQTILVDDTSDRFLYPLSFSGDGRFIAATFYDSSTGKYYIRVYEGA